MNNTTKDLTMNKEGSTVTEMIEHMKPADVLPVLRAHGYADAEMETLRKLIIKVADECEAKQARIEQLRKQLGAAQAKIDALMFEYCPDEMTPEQIAEYEKHVRPASKGE